MIMELNVHLMLDQEAQRGARLRAAAEHDRLVRQVRKRRAAERPAGWTRWRRRPRQPPTQPEAAS